MFSWTRNFYGKKNGEYFRFETKKIRDDAVKNHGFEKCTANEAYIGGSLQNIEWRKYERWVVGK